MYNTHHVIILYYYKLGKKYVYIYICMHSNDVPTLCALVRVPNTRYYDIYPVYQQTKCIGIITSFRRYAIIPSSALVFVNSIIIRSSS